MLKLAVRPLRELYGLTRADAFGPLALECVRNKMIEARLGRRVINQRIGCLKRLFKWASAKQLIPPPVYHGLLAVDGLRYGRSAAKENPPVKPVPDGHVDAVLPFLPPTLRAMVELQRLTGMRSGELVAMRTGDIETAGGVWMYRPARHKTAYLGRRREVALGPRCQALLRPLLKPDLAAPIFSPRQTQAERLAARRLARKTPVQPSQFDRRKKRPRRQPGEVYNTRSYHAALRFGMEAALRAGKLAREHFWFPHQLRHSAALKLRREQSAEAARAYLGHAKVDLTEHYAGMDAAMAISVAEKFG
jgi:integrase